MNLSEDLKARGLVEQSSADLEKIFETKRTVYLGVDPTADSMHAGNLVLVLILRRLALAGHSIILLVGGGTGMIGDPKEKGERVLLDMKTIAKNKKAIATQMKEVIGAKVRIVDNADWLLKVGLLDFLREIGKHFTINDLIKRDIIRKRIETPDESISYTEFTYPLLQGFDFLTLNRNYNCDLQIGGTDQWTNMLSGVDLIRKVDGKDAFVLTTPLITDGAGKKFGKSEGNAIWLDPAKTSPFQFYQFWLTADDVSVNKYLKAFTFLSLIEIDALSEMHSRSPERRSAQRKLALEVTTLVHGDKEAHRAEHFTDVLFGAASYSSLSPSERDALFSSVPSATISLGITVTDALTTEGFISSKSEAKRLIDGKGIKLNGDTVNADRTLAEDDFTDGLAILQKGKSDKLLVRFK